MKTIGDLLDYIKKYNLSRDLKLIIAIAQYDENGTYDVLTETSNIAFEVERFENDEYLLIQDRNEDGK